MRVSLVRAVYVILCLTASCSSTQSGPGGWLSASDTGVLFLQWTENDGQLQGSAQLWQPADRTSTWFESSSSSLTLAGVRNGDAVSLTANLGLGSSVTWNGTIDSAGLTLQFMQGDGTLQPITLSSASVEQYNEAVSHGQAAERERARLRQEQEQQRASAQAAAEDRRARLTAARDANDAIEHDLRALERSVASLSGLDFEPDLREFESAWKDVERSLSEVDDGEYCFERQAMAAQVDAEATYIDVLADSLDVRQAELDLKVGTVEDDVAKLRPISIS